MKRFALTGGIASGKSLVAAQLKQAGIPVVDADQLSRDVVNKGTPGLKAITAFFGKNVLTTDGSLDRTKMGEIVFNNPKKRKELELILHPLIAQAGLVALENLEAAGHPYAIYEAALIFENDLEEAFDATLLVTTTPQEQIQRLQIRDTLSKQDAQKRIESQMSLSEKERRASFVIHNRGTKEELQKEVVKAWQDLTGVELRLAP
mgnify:CR=1 FL=1